MEGVAEKITSKREFIVLGKHPYHIQPGVYTLLKTVYANYYWVGPDMILITDKEDLVCLNIMARDYDNQINRSKSIKT